jgi:hypothetical protein
VLTSELGCYIRKTQDSDASGVMHTMCFEPATLALGMYVGHEICSRELPKRMFSQKRVAVWLRRNSDDIVDIVTNELSDTSLDLANYVSAHHFQFPIILFIVLLLVTLF